MTARRAFGWNRSVSPGCEPAPAGQFLDRRFSGGGVGSSIDRRWPPTTLLGRGGPPLRIALLSAGTEIEATADRPVIRQGDSPRHPYLVIDRGVKVVVLDKNGE